MQDSRRHLRADRVVSDSPNIHSELPRHLLEDDVIELQLIRKLGPETSDLRPPEAHFMAHVREYRFAIHRRSDGQRVCRYAFTERSGLKPGAV